MKWLVLSSLLGLSFGSILACEPDHLVQGCRLEEGACVCGLGCDTTFKYTTRDECMAALKSEKKDTCFPNPCLNSGICTQVIRDPGYKCLCVNTGFYGHNCHKRCPNADELTNYLEDVPVDCIII